MRGMRSMRSMQVFNASSTLKMNRDAKKNKLIPRVQSMRRMNGMRSMRLFKSLFTTL